MKSLFTYSYFLNTKRLECHPLFSIFRFTSLVRLAPPAKYNFLESSKFIHTAHPSHRLISKRSYLVFAWLKYLTTLNYQLDQCWRVKIAMLPSTKSLYTITKAPMAHKTHSKEQFVFKFYHFAITFKVTKPLLVTSYSFSAHSLAYILALTKQLFPVFETNLLYLRYYKVRYHLKELQFFHYN